MMAVLKVGPAKPAARSFLTSIFDDDLPKECIKDPDPVGSVTGPGSRVRYPGSGSADPYPDLHSNLAKIYGTLKKNNVFFFSNYLRIIV